MSLSVGVISLVSFGLSILITPFIRAFAIEHQIGDLPGERKVHTRFIPRLGGISIISGFAGGVIVASLFHPGSMTGFPLQYAGLVLAFLSIVLLGIYDDVKGIGSLGKLIVQTLAAAAIIASGFRIEALSLPYLGSVEMGWLGIPLTLLWVVGVTNAVNLLDGLDGLACGVAAIVSATMLVIGLLYADQLLVFGCTALFFACLGFLRYNFHPASIFMGDTGSLFLGFTLSFLSLRVLQHQSAEVMPISLLVVVVILAVPIVDTSVAFFRRIKKGMHPLKPDKEHIHHRLMDLGLTHRQTVVTIYAITLFNGAVAFLLVVLDSLYATILLSIVLVATLFSIRRLGYLEEMRLKKNEGRPPIQPLSVARLIDRAVLVTGDVCAIIVAFLFSYWLRFHSGLLSPGAFVPLETYLISPAILLMTVFWLVVFLLGGLYELPWDMSRVDYGISILKTVGLGTLTLFFLTLDFGALTLEGRVTTVAYGMIMGVLMVVGRMLIIAIERKYEILGFRKRNTLMIGATSAAAELVEEITKRAGLKYSIVGFVSEDSQLKEFLGFPILGRNSDIPGLVKKHNVEEILVATNYDSREEILEIAARCNGMVPSVKVALESLDVLSGFRVEEIVGHPLIRLFPTNLKTWQRSVKRLIDLVVSLVVLIPLLPVWVLIGIFIKLDSKGPVLFAQERVGKKGKLFTLYKFRSMIENAERDTGPVWALADDQRITRAGKFLRKYRLDEIPQFINVLKGNMSLVGPRPERPFFVEQLKSEIGFYTRRLLVRPGITGWAQVKHRYDTSLEDVRKKVKYDLYYLENMSLTLDLKILFRTIAVALSGKGTH